MIGTEPDALESGAGIYPGLHRMLLRLAGRVPDELITHARALLGGGELVQLPDLVSASAVELGVPLTAAEVGLLREVLDVLDAAGPEPVGLTRVAIFEQTPMPDYAFLPASPQVLRAAGAPIPDTLDLAAGPPPELADLADGLTDLTDDVAMDTLSRHGDVAAVWRAWRYEADGPPAGARRVYLAQADPRAEAWNLAYRAQRRLVGMGEDAPQVEVFWAGDDLPPYQRAALAGSARLWARP